MEKGKMDPQFKNLDPYKVVATLLKLLGNAEGCEYTFTLRKKDEEKYILHSIVALHLGGAGADTGTCQV